VSPVPKSLQILRESPISAWAWKDDPMQKMQIGPIAQELYEVFPGGVVPGGMRDVVEDVIEDERDAAGNKIGEYKAGTRIVGQAYQPWGVDKTAFSFHLVVGWQEHDRLIAAQRADIDELRAAFDAYVAAHP
jgi:hypothetical protein